VDNLGTRIHSFSYALDYFFKIILKSTLQDTVCQYLAKAVTLRVCIKKAGRKEADSTNPLEIPMQ
jgi:hypothetical protein